jgi:hypothetical protein
MKFGRVSSDYTFNEGDAVDSFSEFDYISPLTDKSIPVVEVLLVVLSFLGGFSYTLTNFR